MKKHKTFIEHSIGQDLRNGFDTNLLKFRFPPDPNGYLHIGHVKAIVLNFELAKEYGAKINLRFDDTNPAKEEIEYVNSILEDVRWLVNTEKSTGPEADRPWEGDVRHASDYFPKIYEAA